MANFSVALLVCSLRKTARQQESGAPSEGDGTAPSAGGWAGGCRWPWAVPLPPSCPPTFTDTPLAPRHGAAGCHLHRHPSDTPTWSWGLSPAQTPQWHRNTELGAVTSTQPPAVPQHGAGGCHLHRAPHSTPTRSWGLPPPQSPLWHPDTELGAVTFTEPPAAPRH